MKKKFLLLLITVAMAVSAVGCDKGSGSSSLQAETPNATTTEQSAQLGTFDIEVVRKNIIIKGQPFEIPVALKDLPKGWTWKEHENSHYSADGSGLAYVYYNGEEILIAGLENYFEGSENDGIIYNLTIETDECSIGGLIPFKSTKQDVVHKYGEPTEISKYGNYNYGTTNNNDEFAGRINEQCITVKFDDNYKIIMISITYADLTKEKY